MIGLPCPDQLGDKEVGVEEVHVLVQEPVEDEQPIGPRREGGQGHEAGITCGSHREGSKVPQLSVSQCQGGGKITEIRGKKPTPRHSGMTECSRTFTITTHSCSHPQLQNI